ncbi:MAG: CD225/dispanin family protein [Flavobacteriales bacterium]|nr:CD225/dispanin family protein [Flavobacteriales bacterium]
MNSPQRPKDWLVESIIVTLLCCLPFGLIGIINASSVNSRYDAGDFDGAQRASSEAGKWTKIGFWCGLVPIVLVMLFYGSVIFLALMGLVSG